MTVAYKKTLLVFFLSFFVVFPALGAPGHGGKGWVTVTPSSTPQTLLPQDRDVVRAIRGAAGKASDAQEAYAKFQQTLKTLFEDEGMESQDLLAQLDEAIERLGSDQIENFSSVHQALAARYPEAKNLLDLIEARGQTTGELFEELPPTVSQSVALDGRVRRFGLLTNLSDQAAKRFLLKYSAALTDENIPERGQALAEILTAQGKRFRRTLPAQLKKMAKDVGNGSLEQDLLAASQWVEGRGEDSPVKAAFVAAYENKGGRAASNRSNFWGLVDESEAAREKGDTARVAEIGKEIRERWGTNMGAFLEGMRLQSVSGDATQEEKDQANRVLNRLTAALGEEVSHEGKNQVVFRPSAEAEPVVISENAEKPWDASQWNVADRLTSHFADRTDGFDRSQLLNTPFQPIPSQPEIKTVAATNSPPGTPTGPTGTHTEGNTGTQTPRSLLAARRPAPLEATRPKLSLTLKSCRCYDQWFGPDGRPRKPGFEFTSPHPADTLAGVIERKLEAQGYDVEIKWEEDFEYIGYFTLYDEDGSMLFTSDNDSRWSLGEALPELKRGSLTVHEQTAGAKGLIALNGNSVLNERADLTVIGKLDWAAIVGHSLPQNRRVAGR